MDHHTHTHLHQPSVTRFLQNVWVKWQEAVLKQLFSSNWQEKKRPSSPFPHWSANLQAFCIYQKKLISTGTLFQFFWTSFYFSYVELPSFLSLAQTRTCKSKKKGTEEITELTFEHLVNSKLPNKGGRKWRGGTKHNQHNTQLHNFSSINAH